MSISTRAAVALFLLPLATSAIAADSPDPLEEIVVTAALRDRALRDLPASATVLDSRTLASAGVHHFEDVLALVPNLNWSAGTSRPRFFQLRGIGELEQWQGAPNPSVGFLIDGIDFSGVGMPAMLNDVDRIEVLRGPQGAAYGANALAGLISVNTRAPARESEFDTDVTLGDFGTRGIEAVAGGALGSDAAAWRLAASNYRSDGFRRNAFLQRDDTNGYDESSARLRVRGQPFEHVRADVTVMWADLDNGYDAFSLDNSRVTHSDKPGQDTQLARAVSARLDFDLAAATIVSRSTFGASRSVYSYDGDWGNDRDWGVDAPYDYFQRFDRERQSVSEDLRIVSRASVDEGAAFAWIAGLYTLRTDEDVQQHDTWRDLQLGNGDTRLGSRYRATNTAAYGELEWRIGEATVLAAGARGERRRADYQDTDGAAFSPVEDMTGGSLSLRHAFTDGLRAYLTVARGYKAGGFNIGAEVPAANRSFAAEILHSVELGGRAATADGSLSGDLALFYMRRQDQQVPTGQQLEPGNPLTFVLYTDNAARGENYGLEGTLRWQATSTVLLDLRAALLETHYFDYVFNARDLDGREQAHAPQYQYDLGAEYRGNRGFFARVDVAGFKGVEKFCHGALSI